MNFATRVPEHTPTRIDLVDCLAVPLCIQQEYGIGICGRQMPGIDTFFNSLANVGALYSIRGKGSKSTCNIPDFETMVNACLAFEATYKCTINIRSTMDTLPIGVWLKTQKRRFDSLWKDDRQTPSGGFINAVELLKMLETIKSWNLWVNNKTAFNPPVQTVEVPAPTVEAAVTPVEEPTTPVEAVVTPAEEPVTPVEEPVPLPTHMRTYSLVDLDEVPASAPLPIPQVPKLPDTMETRVQLLLSFQAATGQKIEFTSQVWEWMQQ